MKKITFLLCAIFVMAISAQAQPTIIDQGNCGASGNNLTWVLTYDGVDSILTISGSGDMADYTQGTAPWDSYKSQMAKLVIGDSVTSIGDCAFCHCSGFTGNLIIPNSVTTIGEATFQQCSGFTGSLTIPNSVISIGWGAFYECYFNGSLTIGNSVKTIGDYAFEGCSNFTSLTIGNSGVYDKLHTKKLLTLNY